MNRIGKMHAWCDACKVRFLLPALDDDADGTVMHSASLLHYARMFYDDPVYVDICERTESFAALKHLMAVQFVQRARFAFGAICEPAPDGTPFSFCFPTNCPACDASGFGFGPGSGAWQPVDFELPVATHHRWDAMTPSERMAELRKWVFHPDNE